MDTQAQGQQLKDLRNFLEQEGIKSPVFRFYRSERRGQNRADYLVDCGADILTVDIAHGDSVMMLETLEYVKNTPHVDVIAGNVATPSGVQRMIDCGADAVKVGIGRAQCVQPELLQAMVYLVLTAIALCVRAAREHGVPVIADGGIKNEVHG